MFIPRHPVVENQFCSYGAQIATAAGGVGEVVCYAGSVVKLYQGVNNPNEEPIVFKMAHGDGVSGEQHAFGFAMQKVKTTKEVPMGVAHMGIWDTVHYTCDMTASVISSGDQMRPDDILYPAADEAKVTNNGSDVSVGTAATDKANGAYIENSLPVAKVVKGASLAKCQANFNNTTLYPIRIKLLV